MEKYLKALEFDKIKEKLETLCQTPLGRELACAIKPLTVFEQVMIRQKETTEAKRALEEGSIALQAAKDIRPSLYRANKGGQLNASELWEIGQFCYKAERVRSSFNDTEKQQRYLLLFNLACRIENLSDLQKELLRCLGPSGEVLSEATDSLKKVRKEIQVLHDQVKEKLDHYLKSPAYRKYLQDYVVVERGGRFVLPVKQEYQRQLPGLVHDRSSSGATLFIEPYPLVQLNNKINLAQQEEQREIDRILQILTSKVAEKAEEIVSSLEAYGQLDFILARASLSKIQNASPPRLVTKRYLNIIEGQHPLLGEKAVPVNIHLGKSFSTLVITGPNTGGKTVTLKMVGLMAAMVQAGLHVPAREESEFCIFDNILADIGDEQNIEQSLSTFSGHMTNMIDILQKATSNSLVLLDELGAGTDPSEGSGLAMAILEELHHRGALVIATSHYNELKIFAHQTTGMENASVEFDDYTLKPTFKVLIGIPGSSKAMLIAERLGLSKDIIKRGKELQRRDVLDVESAVSQLVSEQRKYSLSLEKVNCLRKDLDRARQIVQKEQKELEEKKSLIIRKAKEEAASVLRQAKREAREALRTIRMMEKEQQAKKAVTAIEQVRTRLDELEESLRISLKEDIVYSPLSKEDLIPGQKVYVKSLEKDGHIISVAEDGEEIQVQVGLMKVTTNSEDLARVKEDNADENEQKVRGSGVGSVLLEKSKFASPEIDLRGKTVDESIEVLNKYLDDAVLAGLSSARIIHGKGTGSLRKGVQLYLKNHPLVSSFRLGERGEGGSGVTVIYLSNNNYMAGGRYR
ncbi:MAG: endonuclease MutS2 [Firmicutes bacterium]|nr:endonuclease MutS2 [Bacillota bacterium]